MKVRVHIDRVVLDGLPLATRDSGVVMAAIQRTIAEEIVAGDLSPEVRGAGAIDRLGAPAIDLPHGASASAIGRRIGKSVGNRLTMPRRREGGR